MAIGDELVSVFEFGELIYPHLKPDKHRLQLCVNKKDISQK
jgi:hypothetical protein